MKKARHLLALLLALSVLGTVTGCSAAGATLASEKPTLPQARNEDITLDTDFLTALGGFTASTGESVLVGQENVCYSPVSLYWALSMAGTGAGGQTQEEIYALLGAADTETLSENNNLLYQAVYSDDKTCCVYPANSIWMREGVDFYDSFTDNAAREFYASCYTLDFATPGAGKTISQWIGQQTKGLLQPEIELQPLDVMVLLNTVYFKANWVDEFQKSATAEDDFFAPEGAVRCDFMHASRSGQAVAVEGYNLAAVPLKGGWEMFFLLPDEGESIDGLLEEQGLASLLDESRADSREIEWSIPKFSARNTLDLVPTLQSLGVEQAFSSTEADFSNVCDVTQLPGGAAYLSRVEQGTFFAMDEEGVEAAAYTKINMNAGSAAPPDETIEMDLSRPFLYGVRDSDGIVLFLGRCDDPTAEV